MLQQIPFAEIPHKDMVPQAVIGRPVSHFERGLGIRFTQDFDDLDYYEGAALLLSGEGSEHDLPFALMHYRGHPEGTVTLYLDPSIRDVGQISETISAIVEHLGLAQGDLAWRRASDPGL